MFKNQFSSRSNHSTIQAVLSITDKIQQAIENKKYSCGIFLDLSKALDTVDHGILLQRLECYGIRGIAKNWFESYLSGRKQYISIGNTNSWGICHFWCSSRQCTGTLVISSVHKRF